MLPSSLANHALVEGTATYLFDDTGFIVVGVSLTSTLRRTPAKLASHSVRARAWFSRSSLFAETSARIWLPRSRAPAASSALASCAVCPPPEARASDANFAASKLSTRNGANLESDRRVAAPADGVEGAAYVGEVGVAAERAAEP
eukprot:scaffold235739_cov44-Prasinocladus_malaysianus.AAC.2